MLKSYRNQEKPITIGILGGGQLAKMMASEAYRMGMNVAVIENHPNSPAGDMTKLDFSHGWNNEEELKKFIEASDVITLENEFIAPEILDKISMHRNVYPTSDTMRLVQDKFIQKSTFRVAGVSVADFEEINSEQDLMNFASSYGYPFVLKSRKFGYDGYGNATIFNENDLKEAYSKFSADEKRSSLMAEKFIDFKKELAVMVARSVSGEIAIYPCVETIQYQHICHSVIAPSGESQEIEKEAQRLAVQCVEAINGVGVFGIELFLTKNNQLLVNEIAPRPHNTGHYTIEGCYTSQYENALRAILNLPLGSTELVRNAAAMVNLLGQRSGIGVPNSVTELFLHKKAFLHLYNKKDSRLGRKMGHITALGDSREIAYNRAKTAAEAIKW